MQVGANTNCLQSKRSEGSLNEWACRCMCPRCIQSSYLVEADTHVDHFCFIQFNESNHRQTAQHTTSQFENLHPTFDHPPPWLQAFSDWLRSQMTTWSRRPAWKRSRRWKWKSRKRRPLGHGHETSKVIPFPRSMNDECEIWNTWSAWAQLPPTNRNQVEVETTCLAKCTLDWMADHL